MSQSPPSATSRQSAAALARLLARVAERDPEALAALYDATSAKLLGVCVRILQDRTESEDVLQEIYITIWRRAGAFDPTRGVSPVTWLASIARNRAIDRLRARGPAGRWADEAAGLQVHDPAPRADDGLIAAEKHAWLNARLAELEPHVADAIRAAFFEGLTYEILARRLGQPTGTVKSWIRRGLQKLRTRLEP